MDALRPVRWKEGLFLRPHHLQQQQLYFEAREYGLLSSLVAFSWGVVRFEPDTDLLNNYVLSARSLRAVLRDGSFVDVPDNARLDSRNVEAYFAGSGRPVDVAIGIRRRDERQPQTAEGDAPNAANRFRAWSAEVCDLETGREPQPVEFLEHGLRFFVGDEPTDGYVTLPLCRLVATGDRARPIAVDPRYAPPSLTLTAAPALLDAARGVAERLARVLPVLAEARGTQDPGMLILFQALGGALPVVRDMVQDGQVHPRAAYHELARLAGTLLYRDDEGRGPDAIPAYDHSDPAPVFDRLRLLIHQLSEPIFERRWLRMAMERSGDLFRTALPNESRSPGARLLVEVGAVESASRVRMLLMTAKISSSARIETLARHALPGIATEALSSPPPELPPGQTASYFRLRLDEGTEWQTHTLASGELAAFVLGAPADLKLNLVVLLPEH